MKYNYLIYIGRFQPVHFGHLHIIQKALLQAEKLIILLGSSQESRTLKNIWTAEERIKMFQSALNADELKKICFIPIEDIPNDEIWKQYIQNKINKVIGEKSPSIGLIGHTKDESSYYLKLFPQWDYLEVENYQNISATPLRKRFLAGETTFPEIPNNVLNQMLEWKNTPDFHRLRRDFTAT